MTAAGFQGTVGEKCHSLLQGLKLTASANLYSAKMVRVVLDAKALQVLAENPGAQEQVRAMMPSAHICFDIDIAVCQAQAATSANQLSPHRLRKEHKEFAKKLGATSLLTSRSSCLHIDSEHLYECAYESFWLINKVHQCVNESGAHGGISLATRIGSAIRKLVNAHNQEHAKYPDEFFLAAAQTLAFTFVKPLSPASLDLKQQASYMKATWPVLMWARAATVSEAGEDARVLLTDEACPIGNDGAARLLQEQSDPKELSHDIVQTFFATLQLQMPIAPDSQPHIELAAAAKVMQRCVDDAVAQSRIAKDITDCSGFAQPEQRAVSI